MPEHWIPYIHGCVWDRECRDVLAPMRVAVITGRFMVWVDLPGCYVGYVVDDDHLVRRRSWHGVHFGWRVSRGR